MLIRSEFKIEFSLPQDVAMIALLRLHPSFDPLMQTGETLLAEHLDGPASTPIAVEEYTDTFGNRCSRFLAPRGFLRLSGSSLIRSENLPDPIQIDAVQHQVEALPHDVLQFLLSSRYCPG